MGFASLGNILAPSLGPIAGGLLSQYWGWEAVFWLLAIIATAFFVPFLLFFPETCRAIVGDGSVQASGWNRTLYSLKPDRESREGSRTGLGPTANPTGTWTIPNPWRALRLLFCRPIGLVLVTNGVLFGSYYSVTAGIPAQFAERYDLNDLWIGLCFIPAGLGSLFSATVNGVLVDWNYKRTAIHAGQSTQHDQKPDILTFPIERARLQIALPMTVRGSQ